MSANQALYGLGGEDQAGQTDAAPAAVPVAVATPTGSSIDIDVAASAYDPDGPGQPEIAGTSTPASGVVTVVNGNIRYTPFAGYVGLDRFTYTLDNAGKRSSSLVQVTVTAIRAAAGPAHDHGGQLHPVDRCTGGNFSGFSRSPPEPQARCDQVTISPARQALTQARSQCR